MPSPKRNKSQKQMPASVVLANALASRLYPEGIGSQKLLLRVSMDNLKQSDLDQMTGKLSESGLCRLLRQKLMYSQPAPHRLQ
jgi:hypothetical protein